MKGPSLLLSLPASAWDPYNLFNWYWWLPTDKAEVNTEEETVSEPKEDQAITEDSKKEEATPEEEIIYQAKEVKPKRKKRTITKKVKTKSQDAIELILRPTILEELEKEAIITDSTINQVIQIILEAHIDSKGSENLQTEVWKCTYCDPEREFRDYFDFSEHFFNQHMQPGLQKISEFKPE